MRRRALGVMCVALLAGASQTAFQAPISWDLNAQPSVNATGNLVFDSISSTLTHWAHTRYRNGHNLIPGVVPVGTLLYHGRGNPDVPPARPDWVATDPEHSYIFCRGPGQTAVGCRRMLAPHFGGHATIEGMLTQNTSRYRSSYQNICLQVLYFDGSSAAKMQDGPMDTQDVVGWRKVCFTFVLGSSHLLHAKVDPSRYFDERNRIVDLCAWGKQFGVDGYVRMEMDFEIMLCDFTVGVDVVAMANLVSERSWGPGGPGRGPGRRPGEGGPAEPPHGPPSLWERGPQDAAFGAAGPVGTWGEVTYAGSWHNRYPGDRRIQLDLSALVSFYDTDLVPSLVPVRFGQERWDHRLLGISDEDIDAVMSRLESFFAAGIPHVDNSGIDWDTLFKVVVDRYADRIEIVQYILNTTTEASALTTSKRAMQQLHIMLTPYLLYSAKPKTTDNSWAAPIFKFCATSHTSYIHETPALYSRLTSSEHLLLNAVDEVNREICRVVTGMWAQGVTAGLDTVVSAPEGAEKATEEHAGGILEEWRTSLAKLVAWLDWSVWIKCRPECSFEEICYLPTWPFRREDRDSYKHPQPECIPRFE
ncbi:hypothetical protein HMN09_00426500 [Mycena chlorophos]|uniref:Uncharacterized protein n=1 Tax=Mycena chlorophos TaxID=658473 RepID=A0A8H6WJ86_MYCCL|nr:hypothetical protein HMN09_00426500 [Mycena chlorophos]